jgi:hypothetical protein
MHLFDAEAGVSPPFRKNHDMIQQHLLGVNIINEGEYATTIQSLERQYYTLVFICMI